MTQHVAAGAGFVTSYRTWNAMDVESLGDPCAGTIVAWYAVSPSARSVPLIESESEPERT